MAMTIDPETAVPASAAPPAAVPAIEMTQPTTAEQSAPLAPATLEETG
ncbi:MAG: hypothetical protein QOH08_2259, partial [Chloroflexota bacterium]|nr:hypothetical protein [Chloroflexota bacterium]